MEAAGTLLRTARLQAGLSQAELARRAGVTQSVISAYESGARQPSLSTLARLVEATGSELEVHVTSPGPSREPDGLLARRVRDRRDEVLAVLDGCGLTNPRLFGSVARGDERPGSDVDVLVDVPAGTGLFALATCEAQLEALLGAPVDLVPASDLKAGVADEVLARGRRAVSRHDRQRLEDILVALDAIAAHVQRGDLHDGLVVDAVRVRLIEVGEAVKALPTDLLASEADLPWAQIARLRDRLAHCYFDTSHAILAATVDEDLPRLGAATHRLLQRVEES